MCELGASEQEVLSRLMRVSAGWAPRAVDFLEAVEVAVKWSVADPQLEDEAGHVSGNSVIADRCEIFLRGRGSYVFGFESLVPFCLLPTFLPRFVSFFVVGLSKCGDTKFDLADVSG